MKIAEVCPLCGSPNQRPYAMRIQPGSPHVSRARCQDCAIVYANPMAEEHELLDFYQNYYDKGNFLLFKYKELHRRRFKEFQEMPEASLKLAFEYTLRYKDSGNFLDVGFGLGEPLFLADKLGFSTFGTEFDDDAIGFVAEYIPKGQWHKGDLMEADFGETRFDFVRFWHVIEHVLSPRDYLRKIRSILKPDGILMIGTPNIKNTGFGLYRFASFMSQRIPGIVDGMEHTFIFNKANMRRLLEEEGFEIVSHFTHAHQENYLSLLREDLPVRKKVVRFLQSIVHINQTVYARIRP